MRPDFVSTHSRHHYNHISPFRLHYMLSIAILILAFLLTLLAFGTQRLSGYEVSKNQTAEESNTICGQRAIRIALAMLGRPTDLNQILEELGTKPLSLREVKDCFTDRGFVVEGIRAKSYKELSQIANGHSPTIGIALLGADSEVDGHYYVIYRGQANDIVALEPTTESARNVAKDAEFAGPYFLLLVSETRSLASLPRPIFWCFLTLIAAVTIMKVAWRQGLLSYRFMTAASVIVGSLILSCAAWEYSTDFFPNLGSLVPIWTSHAGDLATPEADMIELDIDLGRIALNVPVPFSFEIQNDTQSNAHFESFGQSCTCVSINCSDQSVAPSESYTGRGDIKLASPGRFSQYIYCERRIGTKIASVRVNLKGIATDGVWLKQREFSIGPLSLPAKGVYKTRLEIPGMLGDEAIKCSKVVVGKNGTHILVELEVEDREELFSSVLVTLDSDTPAHYLTELLCTFEVQGEEFVLPLYLKFSVLTSPYFTPKTVVLSPHSPSIGWLRVRSDFDAFPILLVVDGSDSVQLDADFQAANDLMSEREVGVSLYKVTMRVIKMNELDTHIPHPKF